MTWKVVEGCGKIWRVVGKVVRPCRVEIRSGMLWKVVGELKEGCEVREGGGTKWRVIRKVVRPCRMEERTEGICKFVEGCGGLLGRFWCVLEGCKDSGRLLREVDD